MEDKLSKDERIRLECLAQAVQFNALGGSKISVIPIILQAKEFEGYIREGEVL